MDKHQPMESKKIWQIAAYLTLGFVGLLFVNQIFSYTILHYEKMSLRNKIQSVYSAHFNGKKAPDDPRKDMNAKLVQSLIQVNHNHFLNLTGFLSDSVSKTSNVRVEQLSFQSDQLKATLASDDLMTLEKMQKELIQKDLAVQLNNPTMLDLAVTGDLILAMRKS